MGPAVFSSPSPGAAVVLRGVALNTAPDGEALASSNDEESVSQGAGVAAGGEGAGSIADGAGRERTPRPGDDCPPEREESVPSLETFLGTGGVCLEDEETVEPDASGDEAGFESPPLASRPGDVTEGDVHEGLVHVGAGSVTMYWDIYQEVDGLLPGACPGRVDVRCEPITAERREGAVWASAEERTVYVRTVDPAECDLEGLEPQLLSNLFKVCLGRMTTRDGVALSRHDKGLRFLEEGFAQYLLTRPESARFGGRPRAYREFLQFVAQGELRDGFTLDSFWERLPTVDELANPDFAAHPRRIEALYVAGAFMTHLVDNEGLGVEGYSRLWSELAGHAFPDPRDGQAIPREAIEPVLDRFLREVMGDDSFTISACWERFARGVLSITYHRPTVKIECDGDRIVLLFSRPMLPGRVDLMINGMQFGPERFGAELAAWRNDRTVEIDAAVARTQFGIERMETIRVNGGRSWQWFLSEEGIPAEDTTFALPRAR